MNAERTKALRDAGKLLKVVWPKQNLQICFNLSGKHDNVNYNIKESGILSPEGKPNGS